MHVTNAAAGYDLEDNSRAWDRESARLLRLSLNDVEVRRVKSVDRARRGCIAARPNPLPAPSGRDCPGQPVARSLVCSRALQLHS